MPGLADFELFGHTLDSPNERASCGNHHPPCLSRSGNFSRGPSKLAKVRILGV